MGLTAKILANEVIRPRALMTSLPGGRLGLRNAEEFAHFVILEALARSVRLHPRAIDDELRDGSLSCALDYFLRGAGSLFNVDLMVGNVVL
jgi:hypothetical protein